jgi:hypothetical protein
MSEAEKTIKSLRKVNQMLEDRLKKQKASGNSSAEVDSLTAQGEFLLGFFDFFFFFCFFFFLLLFYNPFFFKSRRWRRS